MLGRFLCQRHHLDFWQELDITEIGFMINESVLFEKYLQVINEVGERRLNRARKRILDHGLDKIHLNIANAKLFITLKLVFNRWDDLLSQLPENHAEETVDLINLLKKPFGEIYDYDKPWSISELKKICEEEGRELPLPGSI